MNAYQILFGAVLPSLCCFAAGIAICLLARLKSSSISHQLTRLDHILYTTSFGTAIGCLIMYADTHTMSHGSVPALLTAGILSTGVSFLGGTTGRLIGAVIQARTGKNIQTFWIGLVLASISAVLAVPTLAGL
jgi:prolipoprotein diacylglyceryltransferase